MEPVVPWSIDKRKPDIRTATLRSPEPKVKRLLGVAHPGCERRPSFAEACFELRLDFLGRVVLRFQSPRPFEAHHGSEALVACLERHCEERHRELLFRAQADRAAKQADRLPVFAALDGRAAECQKQVGGFARLPRPLNAKTQDFVGGIQVARVGVCPSEEIETVEQLYLTGLRIKQFHNARIDPREYFEEAIRRDPGDSRSNVQLGLDAFQRGLYPEAEAHFKTAIARIAKDYTRPRDCEAYYHLGRTLKAQDKLDQAFTALYRAVWDYSFRSAAYFELAAIAGRRGNTDEAEALLRRSLETNATNNKALGLLACLLRKQNRYREALATADRAVANNPLDHMGRNERILARKMTSGDAKRSASETEALARIMHDRAESYLELAVDYVDFGCFSEAADVLSRALGRGNARISRYPTIHYYLAYLCHLQDQEVRAEELLESADQCPTDYCFPFRLETLKVYDYALSKRPASAKVHYYRGNLLFDHQPERAIRDWKKAIALDPGLSIAYRNLGWGQYYSQDDLPAAIASYERAVENNREDPRYYYELDVLHQRHGTPIEQRLRLLQGNHQHVEKHALALVREIMVLVQSGDYDRAIQYLSDYFFPIQEGNRRLHDTHVDARLLRGLQRLRQGQHQSALEDFVAADEYPENQQVGRRARYERNPQIYYLTGLCHQALDRDADARGCFEKAAAQAGRGGGSAYAYYEGLALLKLGEDEKAARVFDRLHQRGKESLERAGEIDFFSKFGEGELPHVKRASAYYMIGLSHLGKQNRAEAKEAFSKATELDVNHIWARYELTQLEEGG